MSERNGRLACTRCGAEYAVDDGIVRFSSGSGYAASFALQWSRFSATQVDHRNGTTISADRLRAIAGGSLDGLSGRTVYDAGCGAGRFTAVAAQHGGRVIAVDLGDGAIRACRDNTRGLGEVLCVHADARRAPVGIGSVDVAMSIGVYQHTPDPTRYIRETAERVRLGGQLLFWGYERRARSLAHPKYVLRPMTRRLPAPLLLRVLVRCVPALLRLSQAVRRVPVVGRLLARLVPVADYQGVLPLQGTALIEWAVLDTFDWLSPAHDRPLTYGRVHAELTRAGFAVSRTLSDSVSISARREAA